jgi:hypothetical protein
LRDSLDTIRKEPGLVRSFVRGMVKGLKLLYADPGEAGDIAQAQFPTTPPADLRATLERSFKDEMWSRDGMVSRPAWATASHRGARTRPAQERHRIRLAALLALHEGATHPTFTDRDHTAPPPP